MNIFEKLFKDTEIPMLYPVEFSLSRGQIQRSQISELILDDIRKQQLENRITPGMRIAVTAGSREITNIDQIIKTVVDFIKDCGASPFIFPAIGSH